MILRDLDVCRGCVLRFAVPSTNLCTMCDAELNDLVDETWMSN